MYRRYRLLKDDDRSERSSFSAGSSVTDVSQSSISKEGGRVHHRWVFLTYSKCTLEDKVEFEAALAKCWSGTSQLRLATYYGCREHHHPCDVHYHVLVNLGLQPNWSSQFARGVFEVKGNECESLHISTSKGRQRHANFVEYHVKYMGKEKGGDFFGQRPHMARQTIKGKGGSGTRPPWSSIGGDPFVGEDRQTLHCTHILPS